MIPFATWLLGVILQVLLLARSWRSGNLFVFPFFSVYIVSVLLYSAGGYVVQVGFPDFYPVVYWTGQYITLVCGCAVVIEIFEHVLAEFAGAKVFARIVCLLALSSVVAGSFLYYGVISPQSVPKSAIGVERDVRCTQVILLSAILAVIFYYGVPLARGMNGMIFGYALYLFVSLLTLAERSYVGTGFDHIWRPLQPLSFDVALAVWTIALWNRSVAPKGQQVPHLEQDYETLVLATRRALGSARLYIGRSSRP